MTNELNPADIVTAQTFKNKQHADVDIGQTL